MEITDLNNFTITVTDLPEAIKQADRFRDYAHEDKSFSEFDKRQQAYWTDLYEKLVKLQKNHEQLTFNKYENRNNHL